MRDCKGIYCLSSSTVYNIILVTTDIIVVHHHTKLQATLVVLFLISIAVLPTLMQYKLSWMIISVINCCLTKSACSCVIINVSQMYWHCSEKCTVCSFTQNVFAMCLDAKFVNLYVKNCQTVTLDLSIVG